MSEKPCAAQRNSPLDNDVKSIARETKDGATSTSRGSTWEQRRLRYEEETTKYILYKQVKSVGRDIFTFVLDNDVRSGQRFVYVHDYQPHEYLVHGNHKAGQNVTLNRQDKSIRSSALMHPFAPPWSKSSKWLLKTNDEFFVFHGRVNFQFERKPARWDELKKPIATGHFAIVGPSETTDVLDPKNREQEQPTKCVLKYLTFSTDEIMQRPQLPPLTKVYPCCDIVFGLFGAGDTRRYDRHVWLEEDRWPEEDFANAEQKSSN